MFIFFRKDTKNVNINAKGERVHFHFHLCLVLQVGGRNQLSKERICPRTKYFFFLDSVPYKTFVHEIKQRDSFFPL